MLVPQPEKCNGEEKKSRLVIKFPVFSLGEALLGLGNSICIWQQFLDWWQHCLWLLNIINLLPKSNSKWVCWPGIIHHHGKCHSWKSVLRSTPTCHCFCSLWLLYTMISSTFSPGWTSLTFYWTITLSPSPPVPFGLSLFLYPRPVHSFPDYPSDMRLCTCPQ